MKSKRLIKDRDNNPNGILFIYVYSKNHLKNFADAWIIDHVTSEISYVHAMYAHAYMYVTFINVFSNKIWSIDEWNFIDLYS